MCTRKCVSAQVLLRRILKLDLDDVIYFKLKTNKRAPAKGTEVDHMVAQVKAYCCAAVTSSTCLDVLPVEVQKVPLAIYLDVDNLMPYRLLSHVNFLAANRNVAPCLGTRSSICPPPNRIFTS